MPIMTEESNVFSFDDPSTLAYSTSLSTSDNDSEPLPLISTNPTATSLFNTSVHNDDDFGDVHNHSISLFQHYKLVVFYLFLGIWVISTLAYHLHQRSSNNTPFRRANEARRRNIVSCVVQLLITTIALALQIYGAIPVFFASADNDDAATTERSVTAGQAQRLDACYLSLLLVSVLYVWELLYRIEYNGGRSSIARSVPFWIHRIMTIVWIQLSLTSFVEANSLVMYLRFGLLVGFYATTEQLTFVAQYVHYMCYLVPPQRQTSSDDVFHSSSNNNNDNHSSSALWLSIRANLFSWASAQAFFVKTALTLALIMYYAIGIHRNTFFEANSSTAIAWGWFWIVSFLPWIIILYSVQVYSTWTLYRLAAQCQAQSRQAEHEHSAGDGEMSTVADDSTALHQQQGDERHNSDKALTPRTHDTQLMETDDTVYSV